jgi:anti-anti-sigma factor
VFEENLLSTNVQSLRKSLLEQLTAASQLQGVVADLSSVSQIDSQGLNLLVGLYRECQRRGVSVKATGASVDIVRLLGYVNLAGLFGLAA